MQASVAANLRILAVRSFNKLHLNVVYDIVVVLYGERLRFGAAVLPFWIHNVSVGLPLSNPGINPPTSSGSGMPPLVISGDYKYDIHYTGEPFTWKLQVSGGAAPYSITVNWGDGETTTFESIDGVLNLSHAFAKGGNYQPIVQVTDLTGALVTLQLSAVVKDRLQIVAVASPLMDDIARYLWLLWPVYGIILLMLISFWLGEIEVAHYIWTHKFSRKHTKRHRHA